MGIASHGVQSIYVPKNVSLKGNILVLSCLKSQNRSYGHVSVGTSPFNMFTVLFLATLFAPNYVSMGARAGRARPPHPSIRVALSSQWTLDSL